MKVPKMTTPREGWTFHHGPFLLGVNWSQQWDGWGRTYDDGRRVNYQLACFEPFVATYGYGAILTLWRLKVQVAISKEIPLEGK